MSTPPPPPPPPTGPPPGYQPYSASVPQNHRKATLSLVFGILGMFCIPIVFSFLAIMYGRQAKMEIDRAPGVYRNRGMAAAGYVLGILGLVFGVLLIAYRVSRF